MRLPRRKIQTTFSDNSTLTVPVVRGDIDTIVYRHPETNDLVVRVTKAYCGKAGKAADMHYIDVVDWKVVLQ